MKRTNSLTRMLIGRAISVLIVLFIFLLAGSVPAMGQVCAHDQTQSDFLLGTTDANTALSLEDDGEVILKPALTEEFTGPALGAGWGSVIYTGGTAPSFSAGNVVLNGSEIYSTAPYGPGSVLEFVATFTLEQFHYMGFATTSEIGSPYVFIGRGSQETGDNNLYIRRDGSDDVLLGTGLLGTPHRYKIKWNATNFEFYVDDAISPTATMNYTVASNMLILASDYNPGTGTELSVDWLRVTPYTASGSFTSRVFDGEADKRWGAVTWDADLPSGTGLSVFVSTGGTSVPDETWTPFTQIMTSGAVVRQTARYIRYRADLSTPNTLFTPALNSMTISCLPTENTAPVVTLHPVSLTTCEGRVASFTSDATGNPLPWVVSWESSPDGITWTVINGSGSSTLTLTATSGDNNTQYRAVWTNSINPDAVSNVAILTVNPPLTAAIEAVNDEICKGAPVQLQLSTAATNGQAPYTVVVNGETYTANSVGSPFVTFTNAEHTIWPNTAEPFLKTATDNQPIELGVRFQSSVDGYIMGIRFYNGSDNSGTHFGHLWTAGGSQLAVATFTDVSTFGWQEVRFATPVSIAANTTYVASYIASNENFASTAGGLASAVVNPPLTALANGVYIYGGGFPTTTIPTNYFVDVIFSETGDNPGPFTYNLTSITDANDCSLTGTPINSINVTVNPAPSGALVAVRPSVYEGEDYELAFNAASGSGTYSLEINDHTYTNVQSGTTFTAGTATYQSPPASIWPPSQIGGTQAVDDDALTLGLRFRSSVPGTITGIRFYKPGNAVLNFTVSLWELDNSVALSSAAYTSDNTPGWKQVNFTTPVPINANTTYIASYSTPQGYFYAYTLNYSFPRTSIPLTAIGCSHAVGLAYPGITWPANYWVDVVFANPAGVTNFVLHNVTSSSGCTSTASPVSSASVVVNQARVWTGGGADANWNTPLNWSTGVVPTAAENAVIPTVEMPALYPSVTGPVTTETLIVRPSASMTVEAGGELTVEGDLNTTGATFTINSTAVNNSGSLIVTGTPTGNVTYNRKMPAGNEVARYRYISLPVSSTSFPSGTFWRWNEEQGCWGENPSETPTTLSASGIGYTVAATDNTLSFIGTVLKEITGIVASAPFNTPYVKDRDIWGGGGWNLLGNPFPSALIGVDADAISDNDFIHHNLASFDPSYQAMYIYNGATYSYIALGIPGFTGTGPFSGTDIQAGQGFFVLAHHDQVPFSFTSAMRKHNTSAVMTKSASAGEAWPGLQLKAKYGDKESSTLIVYNEDMTAGLDPGYDIGLLSSGADVEIYTLLTSGGNDFSFTRQALPVDGAPGITVPVGIDSEKGGEVTFSAYTVPLGTQKFWLEDRKTGTYTDLTTKSYTVTLPAKTYGTGRFYIIASANTPTGINDPEDGSALRIWTSNGNVIIKGAVTEMAVCSIFNVQGGLIMETKLTDGELNTVQLPAGSRGVCIVRVTDGPKVTTGKVVVL